MGRENKNAAVAAVHKEKILKSAERLFSEKGFEAATIEEISRASEYSRRTIYAYFQSKEDIRRGIVIWGLSELKGDIEAALSREKSYDAQCRDIFFAMGSFFEKYPMAAMDIDSFKPQETDLSSLSPSVKEIFALGTEINELMSSFIRRGMENGYVRKGIDPVLTAYILWSEASGFFGLLQSKGRLMETQFSMTREELCEYGFKQIYNSILL